MMEIQRFFTRFLTRKTNMYVKDSYEKGKCLFHNIIMWFVLFKYFLIFSYRVSQKELNLHSGSKKGQNYLQVCMSQGNIQKKINKNLTAKKLTMLILGHIFVIASLCMVMLASWSTCLSMYNIIAIAILIKIAMGIARESEKIVQG